MRRELAAIGLAVAMLTVVHPGALAVINPPDLSWMHPGFTFRYIATNTTSGETLEFNVTIDDIENEVLTLKYWQSVGGEDEIFITTNQDSLNRIDRNISTANTTWYTHLWINATILDHDLGTFDTRTFTRDVLELDTHKFDNSDDTVHYHYHTTWGYLVKAVYDNTTETIELQDTRDVSVPLSHGLSEHLDPAECDNAGAFVDNDPQNQVIAVSDAAVCMKVTGENFDECDTDSQAAVSILWPMWVVIKWDYSLNDHNSPQESGTIVGDMTHVPSHIEATPLGTDRRPSGYTARAGADLDDRTTPGGLFSARPRAELTCGG